MAQFWEPRYYTILKRKDAGFLSNIWKIWLNQENRAQATTKQINIMGCVLESSSTKIYKEKKKHSIFSQILGNGSNQSLFSKST